MNTPCPGCAGLVYDRIQPTDKNTPAGHHEMKVGDTGEGQEARGRGGRLRQNSLYTVAC